MILQNEMGPFQITRKQSYIITVFHFNNKGNYKQKSWNTFLNRITTKDQPDSLFISKMQNYEVWLKAETH